MLTVPVIAIAVSKRLNRTGSNLLASRQKHTQLSRRVWSFWASYWTMLLTATSIWRWTLMDGWMGMEHCWNDTDRQTRPSATLSTTNPTKWPVTEHGPGDWPHFVTVCGKRTRLLGCVQHSNRVCCVWLLHVWNCPLNCTKLQVSMPLWAIRRT